MEASSTAPVSVRRRICVAPPGERRRVTTKVASGLRVADFGPLERMGRPLGECLWKPTHHELQDGPGNYGAKLARQLISTMGNTEPS